MTLVVLGVCLLVVGIGYQVRFMVGLRKLREEMKAQSLIHGESGFPVSYTIVVAVLLLQSGVTAFVSMTFDVGPFT